MVGFITVFSDPAGSDFWVFNAGTGGRAINLVLTIATETVGPGGTGGAGGAGKAVAGNPDQTGLNALLGWAKVNVASNGGSGGTGVPPGAGGAAGTGTIVGDPIITVDPSFQDGVAGPACGSDSQLRTSVGPFLANGTRTISVTGTYPWISVEGTLDADGTFSASGRGTMAGYGGILAEFTGAYDEAGGTLVGDYSMDGEKRISAGHPLVYRVEVAVSGGG
jgi:hypothetical protein